MHVHTQTVFFSHSAIQSMCVHNRRPTNTHTHNREQERDAPLVCERRQGERTSEATSNERQAEKLQQEVHQFFCVLFSLCVRKGAGDVASTWKRKKGLQTPHKDALFLLPITENNHVSCLSFCSSAIFTSSHTSSHSFIPLSPLPFFF